MLGAPTICIQLRVQLVTKPYTSGFSFRHSCTSSLKNAVCNACSDSVCENGATCIPELGTENYSCHCLPGFTGLNCGTNIDECEERSCPENTTCADGINSFRCVCSNGYDAPNCTETAGNNEGMTKSTTTPLLFINIYIYIV